MFAESAKKLAKTNPNFRKVLHTGAHSQVVAMSLPAGGDIGEEVHPVTDQLFLIVEGEGSALVGAESRTIEEDDFVFVPAGTLHNITNLSDEDLKLLTIYAPPVHAAGTVQATKQSAKRQQPEVAIS